MTIDEKSFHFFFQSNPTKATELVNQVKEVTGSTDEEIKRAFDQSKDANGEFCLQGAVDYLLAPHGVVSTTTSTTAAAPSYPSLPPPASSPQKTKVVDLTDDNKSEDDLQRAIALSLQDGGLVSQNTAATTLNRLKETFPSTGFNVFTVQADGYISPPSRRTDHRHK